MLTVEDNHVYLLFKRGRTEHINALYERGELYFSSIDFIRNADDNTDRTDRYDGYAFRQFYDKAKLTLANNKQDLENSDIAINIKNASIIYDHEIRGNIYCLSGIFSEELSGERKDITFNTKSLGEDLIYIKHPKIFLERVMNGLKELGYKTIIHDKVEYYQDHYSGKLGFFRKHANYKAQNEFRIFVPNENNEPIKLNIGSLKDIATIKKNCFVDFTHADGKVQKITF